MKKKTAKPTKKIVKSKSKPKTAPKPKPTPVKKVVKKVIKKVVKAPAIKAGPRESVIEPKKVTDIEILENFLGGQNKVKLWKVFLLNTSKDFILNDLIKLTRIKKDALILELRDLMRLGTIKAVKNEHHIIYRTNLDFPLLFEITEIMLSVVPRSVDKILEKLNKLPRLKTVLLSGFFTQHLGQQKSLSNSLNSNIDLLLVFEKVPDNVDDIMSELEYNIGKELSYSALDQNDFKYRHSIGDKLIRDVLDFDHVVAMDKLSFFR